MLKLKSKLKNHKELAKRISCGESALNIPFSPNVNTCVNTLQTIRSGPHVNASKEASRLINLLNGYCEMQDHVRFEIFYLDEHPNDGYKREDIGKLEVKANGYHYLISMLGDKRNNLKKLGTSIPKVNCK